MNNFDNIFDDEEHNFDPDKQRAVKEGIWQTLGTYKFVGQIVDVYVPAMLNVLVSIVGGEHKANGPVPPRNSIPPPPPGMDGHQPPDTGPGMLPDGPELNR